MNEMVPRVVEKVDTDYVIGLLKEFVAMPTPNPPGDSREIADRVVKELRAMGVQDIEVVEPIEGNRSVIARIGKAKRPSVSLYAHLDTVPVLDDEVPDWETPPWEPTIKGDRMYGRGTTDTKCGLACALGAMKACIDAGLDVRGRVILLAIDGAEIGDTWGTKYLVDNGYDIGDDMAIACEPSALKVIRNFKGRIWFEITVNGKAVHASAPELGINAIEKMHKVIGAISRMKLKSTADPLLGDYTLAFSSIHGGILTNTVAGHCKLTMDVRLVPGQTVAGVTSEVQAVLDQLKAEDPELDVTLGILPTPREVMETAADSNIVRYVSTAYKYITGKDPEFGSGIESPGALVYLKQVGADGVFFGPGSIHHAHVPNEYVELQRVRDAAKMYASVIAMAMTGDESAER